MNDGISTSPAAIAACGLSLRRRSGWSTHRQVLDGIDFELPTGAVMGLVGRNGAGKSTLMRCLLGLQPPDAGASSLLGRPSLEIDDAIRGRLGYVAQTPDLFGWLSGLSHLREMAAFYPRFDERRALELALRLEVPLGLRVDRLSAGDQQKLSVVLALGHAPDLLIMDEPVASLDPLARRQFMRALFDRDEEAQRSVLISSHLLADLERVVSHVMFMRAGRVQLVDSWDALIENLRLVVCTGIPTGPGVVHTRRVDDRIHALIDLRRAPVAPSGRALGMDDLFEELNA